MAVTPTYPGVYIEEIPSGVRTITGVATSITAFIGRAPRGPTNEPTMINSLSDFERMFGGLSADHLVSYAVKDFYLNGGSQAIVVRLHKNGTRAEISLPTGQAAPNDVLPLVAANEGKWGNSLRVTVDHKTKDPNDNQLFNLEISEVNPTTQAVLSVEKLLNVSVDDAN